MNASVRPSGEIGCRPIQAVSCRRREVEAHGPGVGFARPYPAEAGRDDAQQDERRTDDRPRRRAPPKRRGFRRRAGPCWFLGGCFFQFEADIGHVCQALPAVFSQGPAQQPADAGGRVGRQPIPVRLGATTAAITSVTSSPSNTRDPGEHLEQHATERPDIAPLVGELAARLLGTHVRGGAENEPRLRHAWGSDRRRQRHAWRG